MRSHSVYVHGGFTDLADHAKLLLTGNRMHSREWIGLIDTVGAAKLRAKLTLIDLLQLLENTLAQDTALL